jgi:prolyl-tRNA synthetase
MEDGEKLHGLPMWQQIKDLMMVDEKGNLILAVIRGDYEVNEVKLAKLAGAVTLKHATEEQIRSIGSEPGFISPVNLTGKVKIIGDISLRTVKNFYGGANSKHKDAININIDRDFKLDIEGDIALAKTGYRAIDGGKLVQKVGIEVGNIFQLGYHYSHLMNGATFIDADGTEKPYYMGSYGIGLGRTMAAIVEVSNDSMGIIWPGVVAPFDAILIGIGKDEDAQEIYQRLTKAGVEVLWDDRDTSPGEKFATADLIGVPVRLVVSGKTEGQVEIKRRGEKETKLVSLDELESLF